MNHYLSARLIGIALAIIGAAPSWAADPARPLVTAHRGGALLMPENTFPAFDNAVRLGADMLEFDMHVTADDQLIIQHDGTVPAFCEPDPGSVVVRAPVRSLTLRDLLKFECGSHHRAIYASQQAVPGTHMPTFDAFLRRYKGSKKLFFGETKMPGRNEGIVDPVAFSQLVSDKVHHYRLEDRFILQSADYRTLDAMHDINPRIRTCLINVKPDVGDYLALAREHHAVCMLLKSTQTNAAQVKQLRDAGVMVFSDVVDDAANWRINRDLGMDAIFTNDPKGLIAFLKADAPQN
jgi:glycerophosphoryl diester phosphodiesterase